MSPDGKRIAGAGASGTLYEWDITKTMQKGGVHRSRKATDLTAIAYAPDNRRIVIGDENGIVRVVTEDTNCNPGSCPATQRILNRSYLTMGNIHGKYQPGWNYPP